MTTKTPVNAIACAPGALPGGPVRTRFFDGMFLTQADLENEQRYWRLKRRLTNRALGEGVVWGLRVDADLERQRLSLSPGYALDCCGNDLIVECPVTTTMTELWTRADPALRADAVTISQPGNDLHDRAPNADRGERSACLVLQYTECPEDARPVHRDACGGATTACETSRIRESTRLLLVPPPTAPPLTPPEQFLADLEKFKNELPTDVRNALFPTPAAPTTAPGTQTVPVHVTVTIPGTPAAVRHVDFLASGTTAALATFSATQTPATGRRTGVVTFELTTEAALHFTGGAVRDQGRTVEVVTPPSAPSVYWSLDVSLPAGVQSTSLDFSFDVDDLQLAGAFASAAGGRLTGRISGTVRVDGQGAFGVEVRDLRLETISAEGFDATTQPGCLRELVPWGWTVAPANGAAIAKSLLLTGLYGFLAEMLARNPGDQRWQAIARIVHAMAWRALFGANLAAGQPVTDAHRRALVELIVDLLERWCAGFFYPGPRCSDEHHGVYLGCAVIDRSNRIVAFDPWEHRRHVLTGPLLTHWAAQLGIAPLDEIVGRFAGAMCCLTGLPVTAFGSAPVLGFDVLRTGAGGNGLRAPGLLSTIHVGDTTTTTDYADRLGADVRWLSVPMLAARAVEAFTAPAGRSREVIAAAIEGGGVVAFAVPSRDGGADRVVHDEVLGLLRRGEHRVRPSGRPVIAEFVGDVLVAAPATAVIHGDSSPGARAVAERAARAGVSASDLIAGGTAALTRRLRLGADDHEAAAELVDIAESTVDFLTATTVKVVGPSAERATFADDATRKRLTEAIGGEVLKLDEQVIDRVASRVGRPR